MQVKGDEIKKGRTRKTGKALKNEF